MLPFTVEDLLGVFETYNQAIWPMQVVAHVLGVTATVLAVYRTRLSSRIIAVILSFLWLFSGIGFFLFALVPIFKPAYAFGAIFIVQAAIFLACVFRPRVSYALGRGAYPVAGLVFIAVAMIGYPVLGYLLGHPYPRSPPFGLAPCPLAVFTFGLFMFADTRVPKGMLAVPFAYAIGGILPASVGAIEDVAMVVVGVVGTAMILYRDSKRPASERPSVLA